MSISRWARSAFWRKKLDKRYTECLRSLVSETLAHRLALGLLKMLSRNANYIQSDLALLACFARFAYDGACQSQRSKMTIALASRQRDEGNTEFRDIQDLVGESGFTIAPYTGYNDRSTHFPEQVSASDSGDRRLRISPTSWLPLDVSS